MGTSESRFEVTLAAFDAANAADPRVEVWQGESWPKELLYAHRMSRWLERLEDEPSEAVILACRAQHLERWTLPRDSYPMDRKGYRAWRKACAAMHARRATEIMAQHGYDDAMCDRVASILRKEGIKSDAETQLMEDVACLVFLEYYFEPFYADNETEYDESKWIKIVQRTWKKMSERGHRHALALAEKLPAPLQDVLQKALSG